MEQKGYKSRSYRDLEVWKLSIDFVKQVYQITHNFPASEKFGLINQIRRAAVSIPSNIAEGQGRNYTKEFQQLFEQAGLKYSVSKAINKYQCIHIGEK